MVYDPCCDLLKIHYLCGDKDNLSFSIPTRRLLWFAQNSLPLRWQRQRSLSGVVHICSCDLLKIHYLCGDKDNQHIMMNGHRQLWFAQNSLPLRWQRQHAKKRPVTRKVVICSKFITFAVTKTTFHPSLSVDGALWFAQNSLPLRWQRQLHRLELEAASSCDLLKIHYLCGDKDNSQGEYHWGLWVVICSKFITFAVTKTTEWTNTTHDVLLWFAQNSLPLRWQRQHRARVIARQ